MAHFPNGGRPAVLKSLLLNILRDELEKQGEGVKWQHWLRIWNHQNQQTKAQGEKLNKELDTEGHGNTYTWNPVGMKWGEKILRKQVVMIIHPPLLPSPQKLRSKVGKDTGKGWWEAWIWTGFCARGKDNCGRRWSKLKRSECAMESSCADSGKRNPPRNAQIYQTAGSARVPNHWRPEAAN